MTIDPNYVSKNFIRNAALTDEIVGKLKERNVKVVFPHTPVLGRLLHKLRCFFSYDYNFKFFSASQDYIKEHNKKITDTPVDAVDAAVVSDALKTPLAAGEHRPLNANSLKVLNAIGAHLGPQAKELWGILFQRFADTYGKDCLSKVEEKSGTFTLHFSQPLKLFLRSLNEQGEEDPPGGAVLTFAAGGQFKLKIKEGSMEMEGLSTFSKTPALFKMLFGDTVEAFLVKFAKSKAGFETVAKKFPKTVSRDRPFEAIKENWGTKAVILASNASPQEVIMSGNY